MFDTFRRDNGESSSPMPEGNPTAFSVDLVEALEQVWQTICDTYDVVADLPDMRTLFEGADVSAPVEAAETVLANMLLEVMASISRFSPWYKKPLGLRLIREEATNQCRWALSPRLYQQWQGILKPLSISIGRNIGWILATDLVDDLMEKSLPSDCVLATCLCLPGRIIRVKRAALIGEGIVCDTCGQPFRPIEAAGPDG